MANDSRKLFRRNDNKIKIAPAVHMRMFVSSIADLDECEKKSCTATPELAQNTPANPTKINAKPLLKTFTRLKTKLPNQRPSRMTASPATETGIFSLRARAADFSRHITATGEQRPREVPFLLATWTLHPTWLKFCAKIANQLNRTVPPLLKRVFGQAKKS